MKIGVFCSGGDAPGMNACVRAVVRSAVAAGHDVVGICHGYQGLLDEDFYEAEPGLPTMTPRSVGGIVKLGGTILRSSRSDEFRTEEGQKKAAEALRRHGIDALIPIGGEGTFKGAMALNRFWPGPIVGCPGTIDNDLVGSDFTLGFQTAVATAVDAVDKLRDTAESHERMFLVEVMGRHSGHIALYTALAGGAEVACLPETATNAPQILDKLRVLKARGKSSVMVIVAEGDETGGAHVLKKLLEEGQCPYPLRVLVLGHLQRGGSPVPADRILGSRLGDFAVRSVREGHTLCMAGEVRGALVLTPFEQACRHRPVPPELLALLDVLAH